MPLNCPNCLQGIWATSYHRWGNSDNLVTTFSLEPVGLAPYGVPF